MPTVLPDGLELTRLPAARGCARCLPLAQGQNADGSAAWRGGRIQFQLRRQAMIKRLRPDIDVVMYRGNLQTRLRKLAEGEVDATLLAYAGLRRLGLEEEVTSLLETEDFLPAVGQGAICIESREGDERTLEMLQAIHDRETQIRLDAERAFLAVLDGSCRTPIGGLALLNGDELTLKGTVLKPDGSEVHHEVRSGGAADAVQIGQAAGEALKAKMGPGFLSSQ
jgi:hydroxymethylbilane synthase